MISLSAIFVAIGCIPLFFLSEDSAHLIYALAFIWGIGFSQALSCVSSLINDVVGSKGPQGAFVYGAFSFADKLSCGIVLLFFLPIASENKEVLRFSIPFFPPAAIGFGFVFVWIRRLLSQNIANGSRILKSETLDQERNQNNLLTGLIKHDN